MLSSRFKNLFSDGYNKEVSKTNIDDIQKNMSIDDFYNYMVQHIVSIGEDEEKLNNFNIAVAEFPKETLLRRYKLWSTKVSNGNNDNILKMDLSSFSDEAVQEAYEIILKKMV